MRIIVMAVIIAAGYGIIAFSAPPMVSADECGPGFYWSKSHGDCVERPDNNPVGAVALCRDGKYSHSESRTGTCSENEGVAQWCPCGGAAPAPSPPSVLPSQLIATGGTNAFVAIAVSPLTGKAGWGTGSSEDEATQKALADCVAATGDVCQMAGGMHNGCAAYAIDPLTSRWHVARVMTRPARAPMQ
jgi:hypothetical protein